MHPRIFDPVDDRELAADDGPWQFWMVKPATPDAAQKYTDIIHDVVMSMTGKYPNVQVYDIMAEEYGTISPPVSPLMANQLHPSAKGQQAEADPLVTIIGKTSPQ